MMRILIVDDEPMITRISQLLLERVGYHVRVVNEPGAARASALDFRPHVVLMDYRMPEMTGCEVAKQFRNEAALKSIPIIFVTATSGMEISEQCAPLAFPVLHKPIHFPMLLKWLEVLSRNDVAAA